MEDALGEAYAPTWAREHVLSGLGERTVNQAFEDGWDARAPSGGRCGACWDCR